MVQQDQLDTWKRGLRSTFPILGRLRRRSAITALESHCDDPAVVPLLTEAVALPDAEVAGRARETLADLKEQPAIDALCALWAKGRDERLGAIIAECGYVASAPASVRALSGLRAGTVDLLSRADGELTPALVAALDDEDSTVSQNAGSVLHTLQSPMAIDALCALWAKGRDERLGAVIAECGYVASAPLGVKVLSALKCGKSIVIDRPDVVPFFASLLGDTDEVLRTGAAQSLKKVSREPARDALCDEAIKDPKGRAARLCLETGVRPSAHERLCLFLFVTRQLNAYFEEDYQFQNLRLQYDRADGRIQGHVMEVVRSGDRRCAGFFGTKNKPLAHCSETEIKLAMDSWTRHQDWSRLFHACLELPLRHSFAAFSPLRNSGWEPESEDLRSAYRQILADSEGQVVPQSRPAKAKSPLFEQWLAQGSKGRLAEVGEAELLERLKTAAPPEGVGIVAALAAKAGSGGAAAKAVRESPHWLIRLAGHAAGMSLDLTRDTVEVEDPNYWMGALASASGVLDFWPGRATPADLEALSSAPAEAFTGTLGAARKVLRTIMGHRITTGTFEEMVVEVDEFAGEFVVADEVEIDTGQGATTEEEA